MYAPALRIPLICYAPATGFVTSFETTFFCRSLQSDKGPPGLHCFEGAQAQNSKPGNFSTPQPCYQGRAGEVLSSGCLCVDFPCRVCNVGCWQLECSTSRKIGGVNVQCGIFMKLRQSPSLGALYLRTGFFCPPGSSTAYGAGACPLGPDPQISTDVHRYGGGVFSTLDDLTFWFGFSGCRSALVRLELVLWISLAVCRELSEEPLVRAC